MVLPKGLLFIKNHKTDFFAISNVVKVHSLLIKCFQDWEEIRIFLNCLKSLQAEYIFLLFS